MASKPIQDSLINNRKWTVSKNSRPRWTTTCRWRGYRCRRRSVDCTEDTRLSTAGCQYTSDKRMFQTTSTSSRMTNSGFRLTCLFFCRLLQVGRVSQRASKGQTLENAEVGFFYSCRLIQWRRSVVKCGGQGQSSQAIKLFQATWKIGFTFHFWHCLSSLVTSSLQSYPTTVLNDRMWHFKGVKTYSDPPTYFQRGSRQNVTF